MVSQRWISAGVGGGGGGGGGGGLHEEKNPPQDFFIETKVCLDSRLQLELVFWVDSRA